MCLSRLAAEYDHPLQTVGDYASIDATSLRESRQVPRLGPIELGIPYFGVPCSLLVSPYAGAIQEGHSKLDAG